MLSTCVQIYWLCVCSCLFCSMLLAPHDLCQVWIKNCRHQPYKSGWPNGIMNGIFHSCHSCCVIQLYFVFHISKMLFVICDFLYSFRCCWYSPSWFHQSHRIAYTWKSWFMSYRATIHSLNIEILCACVVYNNKNIHTIFNNTNNSMTKINFHYRERFFIYLFIENGKFHKIYNNSILWCFILQ